MSRTALEARGLGKAFGGEEVVADVDLSVEENEILLLMGPNGVGKTVLLSCLAGSERPSAGEVELFGAPLDEDGGEGLAVCLQDSTAIETLTGRENVEFYAGLHPGFSDRWATYARQLDFEDELDSLVEHYSGGTRRKLELALTLSVDAPVYLLDEPTAGVDLSMIQRFHDIVLERYDDGATVVVTSHRPMDVDLADRIAFVPDGSVSAVGTPEELLEAVPRVVRVTGTDAIGTAEDFVVDGRLFPLGGEARGFLAPACDVAGLRAAVDGDAGVEAIEPTYADLFNYHVHVRPDGGGR